jgi:hypothetical protein
MQGNATGNVGRTLLSAAVEVAFQVCRSCSCNGSNSLGSRKCNFKGGRQECPPHTLGEYVKLSVPSISIQNTTIRSNAVGNVGYGAGGHLCLVPCAAPKTDESEHGERALSESLRELVREGRVQMIGPIRQELLSGIRDEQSFRKLRDLDRQ